MDKIKVLHTGDFHLGYDYGKYEEHSVERAEENMETFGRVVDLCRSEQADIMLIAGDLFDNDNPKDEILYFVIDNFKKIEDVIVMIAPGNHDYYRKGSFYEKISTLCQNVFIFDGEMDFYEFNIREITVRIYGAGFTAPIMKNSLMGQRKMFRDNAINIGVFHGEIGSARDDSKYAPMSLRQIENNCFDYLALGHIHKQTEVLQAGGTNYAYCGCPEGLNFKNLGIKGVYIGDVGQGYADMRYVRTCRRMYIEETVHIRGEEEPKESSYGVTEDEIFIYDSSVMEMAEQIRNYLLQKYGTTYRDNLYKIVITGTVPDKGKIARLEREFADIYSISVEGRQKVQQKSVAGKQERGKFIIDSIHIVNFGGLKNYRMNFHKGFQIVYGENEAGKSTIMAFIKMMLYGCASKSRDISQNPRKKYQPFDGSLMKGSMEFTLNHNRYRVEREFGKSKSFDVCRVLDIDGGTEISFPKEYEVGDYFLAIPLEDFNKTMFAGTMTGMTETGGKSRLLSRIAGLSEGLDESIDVSEELEQVTKQMEQLLSKRGTSGRIPEIDERISTYKTERDRLTEELEYLMRADRPDKEGLKREKKVITGLMDKMKRLEEMKNYETDKKIIYLRIQKGMIAFLMAAVLVCAAAGMIRSKDQMADILILTGGLTVEGLLLIKRIKINRRIKKYGFCDDDENLREQIDVIMEEFGYTNYSIEDLEERLNKIDEMLSQASGTGTERIERRIRECTERIAELGKKKNVLLNQHGELKEQAERLRTVMQQAGKQITSSVNERAVWLFCGMTGKEYESFLVDEDFNIRVKKYGSGIYEDWRHLSTAAASQAYLSLRISLCEMLGDGKVSLPMLFDDSLSSYDEKRSRNTIEILKQLDTQVILFTCHYFISEMGGKECQSYMKI